MEIEYDELDEERIPWHPAFVENKPDGIHIPEVRETEEEKSLSIGRLKYCYLQIARQKFQGKVFTNKDTLSPIRVSRDGIMEWWRKSRKREHIISVQLLDFFLENGIFRGESLDYKNRPEIEGASEYESICKVNGKLFKVIIIVRKSVNDIAKFRYYTLRKIKIFPV
jgi:hypothetical protein